MAPEARKEDDIFSKNGFVILVIAGYLAIASCLALYNKWMLSTHCFHFPITIIIVGW